MARDPTVSILASQSFNAASRTSPKLIPRTVSPIQMPHSEACQNENKPT
ncbi:hypothetical protein RBWH47_02643 [Rhodopirellula baltica WH47]|uniref:Uncharacterized protein n=1 Tax=Rhodopirellula baltica WH47 TaxID=991778 RepID=F2AM83_RHOBT|nr:hypothetical protein RBWH47_02643 [Rhodopirellula baltica WH47]